MEVLNRQILGNALWQYGLFLLVVFGGMIAYALIQRLLARLVRHVPQERQPFYQKIIELIRGPLRLLVLVLVLWLGLRIFRIPQDVDTFLSNTFLVLVALVVTYGLIKAVDVLLAYVQPLVARTESRLDDQLLPLVGRTLKVFIILVAALLVIQNLGYDITSLIAGLGLGGLALALAAQQTLSNIFGAVTLFIDRPFQVGDAVSVEGFTGTIEAIGLRSTRLRTFDGTLVTLPNNIVANAKIDNWQARPTRRTNFTIGVTYDTSYEKLQEAVQILRDVMASHPGTAQYRAYFNSYGDYSLNIMANHWCKYLDYEEYLKCLEEINFEIKRRFEAAGIEFAFPSQTIYLQGVGKGASEPERASS